MASFKIHTIIVVLILIQTALAKPFDDTNNFFDSSEEEMRKNPTPAQKLLLYTFDHFVNLGKHLAENSVGVSRNMLKDESLVANTSPEVVEFKKNLTRFVEKYESTKSPLLMWDVIDIYSNTTDNYFEAPEEKMTPESTFILNILNKYNGKDVIVKFAAEFLSFMENFVKLFEENKQSLEKPMLDWYAKYQTLENMDDKIDAFSSFIELA